MVGLVALLAASQVGVASPSDTTILDTCRSSSHSDAWSESSTTTCGPHVGTGHVCYSYIKHHDRSWDSEGNAVQHNYESEQCLVGHME